MRVRDGSFVLLFPKTKVIFPPVVNPATGRLSHLWNAVVIVNPPSQPADENPLPRTLFVFPELNGSCVELGVPDQLVYMRQYASRYRRPIKA